jgi:endonuclease/exonuclease/phosphatase family metal-dependent hydrolase
VWNAGGVWAQIRPTAFVLALAIGAGVLAGTGPVTSAGDDIRLVQFNLCGHVCRDDDADKVGGVVNSLAGFHPMAVSLNELCRPQLAAVLDGISRRGWAMHARFLVTERGGCRGGVDYGIAVLTRTTIVDADPVTYAAQNHVGTTELRGLLCAKAELGSRPTRICTSHVVAADEDPSGDIRREQVAAAARWVAAYRVPVVVMGDFNLRPTDRAMSALYTRSHRGGGDGRFDEVDQGSEHCRCGEHTYDSGGKYDYIFVSAHDFVVAEGDATASRFSDHDLLRGWVITR